MKLHVFAISGSSFAIRGIAIQAGLMTLEGLVHPLDDSAWASCSLLSFSPRINMSNHHPGKYYAGDGG